MTDGLMFKGDNNYLEVVGMNSYCFEDPFIPELSNLYDEYSFNMTIGRIANKYLFSIGFSEEYVSGKHYDTLIGFGFGVCGFSSAGEVSSLENNCRIVFESKEELYNCKTINEKYGFNPGDFLEFKFVFKEYICRVTKNKLLLFDIYLPKIPLFFCISNACYTGISSIKLK